MSKLQFKEPDHISKKSGQLSIETEDGLKPRISRSVSEGQLSNQRDRTPPKVAFDTFCNQEATDFALTLRSTHQDYKFQRLSRTFLCGTDDKKYSENALEWLFEQLVQDNDEVICLRAIDPDDNLSESPENVYRAEAQRFMNFIKHKNSKNVKISLTLEFALGKVQDMIQRMIQIYEPALLVVGTRGKSTQGFRGLIPGSISKYCLQHSPIPVVVVRPTQKREKRKARREADSGRHTYKGSLLAQTTNVKNYSEGCTNEVPPDIPWYMREEDILTGKSFSRDKSPSRSRSPFRIKFSYRGDEKTSTSTPNLTY